MICCCAATALLGPTGSLIFSSILICENFYFLIYSLGSEEDQEEVRCFWTWLLLYWWLLNICCCIFLLHFHFKRAGTFKIFYTFRHFSHETMTWILFYYYACVTLATDLHSFWLVGCDFVETHKCTYAHVHIHTIVQVKATKWDGNNENTRVRPSRTICTTKITEHATSVAACRNQLKYQIPENTNTRISMTAIDYSQKHRFVSRNGTNLFKRYYI